MKSNMRLLILAALIVPFMLVSCRSTRTRTTGVDSTASLTGAVQQGTAGAEPEAVYNPSQWRFDEVRSNAVRAGAEDHMPEHLAAVDELAASSLQKFERGDIEGSIRDGREGQERYLILQTLAEARTRQMEADEQDFFFNDPETYMDALESGVSAVDHYNEGRLAEAKTAADEALLGFDAVLRSGWAGAVEEKTSAAVEWRTAALEARADVAVRSDFAAAERTYDQAQTAQRAGQYTRAMELYDQSTALFKLAHDNALERREMAEEALHQAELKLAESEERAQYAEDLIGGGE